MKPTFRIPKGHHLIRKTDVRYKIISGNVKMDSYSLQQFFNDSKNLMCTFLSGKSKAYQLLL